MIFENVSASSSIHMSKPCHVTLCCTLSELLMQKEVIPLQFCQIWLFQNAQNTATYERRNFFFGINTCFSEGFLKLMCFI